MLRGRSQLTSPAPFRLPMAPVLTVEHVGYWTGAMRLVTPGGCELPIKSILGNSVAESERSCLLKGTLTGDLPSHATRPSWGFKS